MTCSGVVLDLYGGGAGTDQWLDHSVHGNDGTLTTGTTRRTLANRLEVITSNGVDVDDQFINVEDSISLDIGSDTMTCLMWVYYGADPTGFNGMLFHKGTSGGDEYYLYNRVSGNAINYRVHAGGGDSVALFPTNAAWEGNWKLLAGVYDGANVVVYVDAVAGTPVALTGAIDSTTGRNLAVGARWSSGAGVSGVGDLIFNGSFWRPRLLTYPLSQPQIGEIYNQEEPWFR